MDDWSATTRSYRGGAQAPSPRVAAVKVDAISAFGTRQGRGKRKEYSKQKLLWKKSVPSWDWVGL